MRHPIARAQGLLVESIGAETVVYDLESKEAHCLKPLAAAVFEFSDGRNTTSDIAELAAYRLGMPVTEPEVTDALAALERSALLDVPVSDGGVSRREAIRRIAATGAGAIAGAALITTVAAQPALAAGSQVQTGDCCGSTAKGDSCEGLNPVCIQNHCCQNNGGKSCNECKCVGVHNDCEVAGTCDSSGNCPTGQQCIGGPGGMCCTAVVSPGGGIISC